MEIIWPVWAIGLLFAVTGKNETTLILSGLPWWHRVLALLWQIFSGAGFPNQFFSDSWVVGLMEGRPWRTRGWVGKASLGGGSGHSWSVWVTRRGSGCVRFT